MNGGLQIDMNKKILIVILGLILFSGIVSANIIATIGMKGLNFINPTAATVVRGILCATSPLGVIGCVEQYVEGKIVGTITGEIFNTIAQVSPKAAKAILTYNQIKGYINQGTTILEDLNINDQGQIEQGILDFNEEGYSLNDFFANSTAEDIVVSNVTYDFLNKEITIKENGFLKLTLKDEQGNEKEFLYKDIKEGGIFKLNATGEIEEAWFFSSKDSAEFEFPGFDKLVVEEGAEISYQDGKITVHGDEFLYGDNMIQILSNISPFAEIEGNNLKCANCKVGDIYLRKLWAIPASIDILNNGFLVNHGEVNYKQNQFNVVANNVLIANPGVNMIDYSGTWIRQTTNLLEIQSSIQEECIKIEFLENHEILNTDDKDLLHVDITKGDGLIFENRENRGLIPRVIYKNSENGVTYFTNDKIHFEIDKDGFTSLRTPPLTEADFSRKYQSVAFEIESDSFRPGEKLRINSYRQFVMLDGKNNEVVTYNTYKLPVSTLLEDNSLQTIEELRAKYPDINFGVYTKTIPPYLLYLTDQYFKDNPEVVEDFNEIRYNELFKASGGDGIMIIGRRIVDFTSTEWLKTPVRDITNPLQILEHEHIHIINDIIQEEEIKEVLKGGKVIPGLFTLLDEKKQAEKEYNEAFKKAPHPTEITQEQAGELNALSRKVMEIDVEISKITNDYYEGFPLLKYEYNELSIYVREKLKKSKGFKADFKEKIVTPLIEFYTGKNTPYSEEYLEELEDLAYFNEIRKIARKVPDTSVYSKELEKLVRSYSGLYVYSFYDYNHHLYDVKESRYEELPTTYLEQPIDIRRSLVNSENALTKEVYKKLTQLAFDSGQIKVDEYKAIMGSDYCKIAGCLDKLCVEYKLLCCLNNPNSPNC